MSMRIQFPLQFNASNVRLVVAGSCLTLFKGQIPYGELKISFERSKIALGERIISFGRAKIPFGKKFIIALQDYIIFCLCYNKVTVLFRQNVCGKRYQLNLFSSVFCATFLQSFLFCPYSISTPLSSFSFQSYFLFFNSFILHFYTSTAVDTCSLRLRIFL